MARVPISFYLNIIAGLFVLFHHYASAETGDVALNKITGAAGRFATLFYDTTARFGSRISRYDASGTGRPGLDGWEVASALPRDTVESLRTHCCGDSGDGNVADGQDVLWTEIEDEQVQHQHEIQPPSRGAGGYGSDSAWAYQQPSMRLARSSPPPPHSGALTLGHLFANARHHYASTRKVILHEAVTMIAAILARTYAAYRWFKAPLLVTGVLISAHSILSVSGVLGGGCILIYGIPLPQVYVMSMMDFLQCIQWEAQRLLLSGAGVAETMELIRNIVKFACTRIQGLIGF